MGIALCRKEQKTQVLNCGTHDAGGNFTLNVKLRPEAAGVAEAKKKPVTVEDGGKEQTGSAETAGDSVANQKH